MGDDEYVPRQITFDDLGELSLDDAYAASMVAVEDGQLVTGTVVKVDRDEVLLDIGYKSEGVIPNRELSIRNEVDPSKVVTIGDEVEALVLQKEDKEGRLILSKKRAQYERAWGKIEEIKENEGVVAGPVIEVVKGGLIIDIGLRGFLPASLVELRRVRDLQPYVGKTLEAKIIELDKNRNNVVLSRRAWLEETQKEQREDFLANLKPGERRKGVVSSVVNFGAFVDLGGMDGLIHVSELSWKHVDHPGSVVAVGDEVEVEVLEVDLDRERISLSLKATQQDPWQEFASNHQVGELVYGRVTKLVPFGAFIQVGDGIEGLVHISEMSAHHVDLPEQVVTPGRGAVGQDHRSGPGASPHLAVDQAGRRGWRRGRGVPAALRRGELRRRGQLHRRVADGGHLRGPGGLGGVLRRAGPRPPGQPAAGRGRRTAEAAAEADRGRRRCCRAGGSGRGRADRGRRRGLSHECVRAPASCRRPETTATEPRCRAELGPGRGSVTCGLRPPARCC